MHRTVHLKIARETKLSGSPDLRLEVVDSLERVHLEVALSLQFLLDFVQTLARLVVLHVLNALRLLLTFTQHLQLHFLRLQIRHLQIQEHNQRQTNNCRCSRQVRDVTPVCRCSSDARLPPVAGSALAAAPSAAFPRSTSPANKTETKFFFIIEDAKNEIEVRCNSG